MALDVGGHRPVDMREDVRRGVMQRVVEIEYPDGCSGLGMQKHPGSLRSARADHGAYAVLRQDFQQQSVRHTAINNMDAFDAVARGI